MKKRNKKLHITIDSLPAGLDNGNIMDGGGVPSSSTGSLTSLIGISIGLRKRKNFSLILLAGLSALLCALYYTSYYPGAVWTLRFGVTSSTGSTSVTNNHQGLPTSTHTQHDAGGFDKEQFLSRVASDGNGGSGGDIIIANSHVISSMSNIHGGSANSHHQHNQINENGIREGEGAEDGGNPEEISTPQTWNWKYWASLEYWKVNFSAPHVDDVNDDDFSHRLSGKTAGGGSAPAAPDFPSAAILPGGNADAAASATGKVPSFHRNLSGRLACNFPRLNPFDPSIIDFIKSPPVIDCTKNYPLVFRTDFRNTLIQSGHPFPSPIDDEKGDGKIPPTEHYSCCYKTMTRGNGSDHNIIFSKRCYPIVKAETVIPASHEFISVRCRSVSETRKGPSENYSKSSIGNANNSGNNGNNNTSNNIYYANTTTRVYRDMFSFVPLKPLVESRIREYEERKRKLRYVHKKVRSNNNNSGKQEKRTEMKMENTQQQQQPNSINENYHETPTNEGAVSTAQDATVGSVAPDEEHPDPDRLNVVVLGLDAQSHMNFIRQMPQTNSFLTRNLSSIPLFGYNKIGDNTMPNLIALLTGLSMNELEKVCWPTKQSYFDSCPFIWKNFSSSGYRTLFGEDAVWMGMFHYEKKGRIEERMPLVKVTLPAWFRTKYPQAMKNLAKNALRLTTPFDVFETLMDILRISQGKRIRFDRWYHDNEDNKGGGSSHTSRTSAGHDAHSDSDEKPPRGISLFRPIPLTRTCKMAGIEAHWCVCHSLQSVPINSTLVQSGAQFIVQVINGLVRKHSESCAKLGLFKINEAKRKIDGDIDRGLNVDFLFASSASSGSDNDAGQSAPVAGGTASPGSGDKSSNLLKTRTGRSKRNASGEGTSSTAHKNKTDRVLGGKFLKRLGREGVPAAVTYAFTTKASSRRKREESILSLSTTSDIKTMIQLQITVVTWPGDAVFEATIYGEAGIGNGPVNDEGIDQEAGERSNHHWKLSGDISRLNLYGKQSACISDYTVQKYCYCHNLRIE